MNKLFRNRIVSMLLVFVMVFSMLPTWVLAEDANAEIDWAAKAASVKLTGKWRDDLVAIAQTQLGYTEEDGVSLYGEWNGTPDADWTALFINWVATQAGLTKKQFPHGSTYKYLRIEMNDKGALIRASRYNFPSIGDLALIEVDGKKLVGIITYIDNGVAAVIHGDDNGAVTRDTYTIGTAEFDYYVNLDVLMEKAGIDLKKGGDVPTLPENGIIAWTNANSVSIREDRTTASKRVGTVKKAGAVLTVTSAQKADDGYIWYGVNYEGTIGFIRGDLLTLDKQALPAVTATPVPTVVPTAAPVEEEVVVVPSVELPELQAMFDAAVEAYYRDFDGELWILFETMVATMTADELYACNDELANLLLAIDALPTDTAAAFCEANADKLAYLSELYEAVSEAVAKPRVAVRGSDDSIVDTSVSGEYFNVIKEDAYNMITGATEYEIILNNDAGNDRKEVHVFAVDASEIDVLPGYYAYDKFDPEDDSTWKAMEVTKTAKYYEDTLGYTLIGGMNIALAYDSNAPYGFFVFEGKVLEDQNTAGMDHHPNGNVSTYLAIDKNGKCDLRSASEPLTGDERFAVGANFGWLVKDGVLQSKTVERTSSDASRSMLGIKADGTLMVVHCDGRNGAISSGLSNYEMGELMLSLGCVDAVNGDGGGSSTFISRRPGDDGLVMRSTPSDGSERPTLNSVFLAVPGNKVPGTFDHAEILANHEYMVPNAAYDFDAVAIDVTAQEMTMPAGGAWSLPEDSAALGAIDANGVFTSNGTLGTVTVQYTVEGKTATKSIVVCNPAVAAFALNSTVLPYGKSTTLEILMYQDEAKEFPVFFTPDAFSWAVSNEAAGQLEGLTYTATTDESVKGVTITATYKYAEMAALTFVIEYGKGSELIGTWNFEDGDVADWMGFVDAKQWSINNGVNNTLVGSSPLAGQYNDQISSDTFLATRSNGQVKNGNHALGWTLDYTDADFAGWSYNHLFFVGEEHVFRNVLSTTPENEQKKATTFGFWVYIPEGAAGVPNPEDPATNIQGGLAFMTQFWGTNNDGKTWGCHQEHFKFKGADGNVYNLNATKAVESVIPASRWVYAYIDMSGYQYMSTMDPFTTYENSRSPSFIRVYIKPMLAQKLTFYFDDMTLDYSSAVDDREQPIIGDIMYATSDESVKADGATIAAGSVVFSATVADDTTKNNYVGLDNTTAQIYVDGVKVATSINGATMATTEAVVLDNGEHMVTFEIADRMGNRAQKNATITVGAAADKGLVYMTGHNDSGEMPEYGSTYYVDIKTTDVTKVNTIEANIRLNTANTWELEHMLVAPGFKVEYEQLDAERNYLTVQAKGVSTDIHSVENVVRITLTKTVDCTLTGEQTLVSLPVRVWTWDGVNNTTGTPITPEEHYKGGYNPIVNIDVDVLYGSVNKTATFGGSMSVKTKVDDVKYEWHYHHTETPVADKAANCLEAGYTGRTYCEVCQSVVNWGTLLPATGHTYEIVGDQITCGCGVVITGNGIIAVGDKLYYLIAGKLVTGWQNVDGTNWCYADPATKEVVVGEKTINGIKYTFDENGITAGAWVINSKGTRYSTGPEFLKREWKEIDGATYYFGEDAYMFTGIRAIAVNRNNIKEGYNVYDFGEDGKMVNDFAEFSGIMTTDVDGMFYMENGLSVYAGLLYLDTDNDGKKDAYYYARTGGTLVCGKTYWITKTNDLLPAANYTFGADGKMLNPPVVEPEQPPVEPEKKNGIVSEGGKLWWYVDDVKTYAGLMKIDGDYYYARSSGEILTNTKYWISKTNDLLPAANYEFGADGKMLNPPVVEPEPDPEQPPVTPEQPVKKNGIVEEGGKLWWYVDDVKTYAGLMYLDTDKDGEKDAYYYARSSGEILTNTKYWITKTNDLLPAANYEFGADGKMLNPPVVEPEPDPEQPPVTPEQPVKKNGIVEEGGKLWWYVDDVKTYAGLMQIDGDYYYARSSGEILTNTKYWITKTNGLLPAANYTFGADGKMVNPPAGK